ncbi:RNA polymerase sigma factor [Sphingobacterium corticibacter]|uniref:RNA polymerase sigma-70 factor n=1 Tax=Sphingobacterium corticibacter TaxID=2171749 RepID=A0A2T8HKM3_9SPHI|nr:RNA polymerase sigma-70 factor [Sphingobacterium corticibacter]PVH25930.1 RNA polymerase sigma-70 factor [Sphingobacterium corticibacter]
MEERSKHIDQYYIVGLKNRDKAIFEKVYDLYWSSLYISAFNVLRNKEQSEDVVQEVFSSLWNNAESLAILNLNAWLFSAVRYQVFNILRSGKVRTRFENLYIVEELTQNIGELKLVKEDLHRRMLEGIEQLPPRCREIFILSRIDRLSHHDIAVKLAISVKSVENQISIAQKKLRISLKDLAYLLPLLFYRS